MFDVAGKVSELAADILSSVGIGEDSTKISGLYQTAKNMKVFGGELVPWDYSGEDWYKVFPYQFSVLNAKTGKRYVYTMPIPPQSLTIKMIPASTATATVGGVVEETSDNVFWVIQMSGTTGTGVSRGDLNSTTGARKKMADKFRKKLETTGLLSGVAANLQTLIGKAAGTADALLSGDVIGAVNNALLPQLPYSGSSVDGKSNGYTEMQELHRFLYTFSNLKGVSPDQFLLEFWYYKMGQKWRIVLQDFTMQISAQNPNLYRYNIQLKAWNVRPVSQDERSKSETDRYAKGGDLHAVNTVGIDGLYKGFQGIKANFNNNSKSVL